MPGDRLCSSKGVGIGREMPQSIMYTEEGIGLGLLHEGLQREEGEMVRAGQMRTRRWMTK